MRQSRIPSGQSRVPLGDAWMSSGEAWLTAGAFWLSSLALAVACMWHAQHPVRSSSLAHPTVMPAEVPSGRTVVDLDALDSRTAPGATESAGTPDITDSAGAIVIPQDVIVARPGGNALMQKVMQKR